MPLALFHVAHPNSLTTASANAPCYGVPPSKANDVVVEEEELPEHEVRRFSPDRCLGTVKCRRTALVVLATQCSGGR
jgi:hypothetical protein